MAPNPFYIEGPAQIGVSGGRTSAWLFKKILEAYDGKLPENVFPSFQNTGEERGETLDFLHEIETRWHPIYWTEYDDEFDVEDYRKKDGTLSKRRLRGLDRPRYKIVTYETASRNGEPYKKMLKYYNQYRQLVKKAGPVLPNVPQRMCTAHLKIKVFSRFMKQQGFDVFDSISGIRADEPKRYRKMMEANDKNQEPYFNVCPLYEARVSKPEILHYFGWNTDGEVDDRGDLIFTRASNIPAGFDLKLDANSDEGNCNLCFLKRYDKIVSIMKKTDEYDEFWIGAEEEYSPQTFRRDRPTYKETRRMIDENDPKLDKLLKIKINDRVVDCICGE